MWPFKKILELFEGWIDPLATPEALRPPDKIGGYFWHYLRQAKLPFFSALVLGGVAALLEATFFYYIGRLVDILDTSESTAGWQGLIGTHGGELALMVFVVLIARFLVAVVGALVDEQTLGRGFRNLTTWQSYLYVARQSLSFFNNQFSGSVVTKVSQGGGALVDFMAGVLQVVWTIAVFTTTTLVLFLQLDWRLAAIIGVWLVLFSFLARYFVPRIRANAVRVAETRAALNGRVTDGFANIQTLKLFGRTDENDDYVREGYENFLETTLAMGRLTVGLRAAMTMLSGAMITTIGIVAVDLWSRDQISVGTVAFAMALVLRLNMWFGRLMGGLNGLMRNYGIVQNAMETIALPLGIVDAPDAKELRRGPGAIKFENLSFNYAKNREVIEDFNLEIAPGEKIGLVGRSGAGKTTLVNLLLRFYDLDSGRISIDGQDIAGIKQDSLRSGIGVVTQDTALLHRSVRDNIIYGRPDASDAELYEAARRAGAHDFITDIVDPAGREGYAARVGERGIKLSGGQRQRIAIARVILKDAPILVLDEATSALDSEIEAAIQQQLHELMHNKTVLAIAHRLSTIAAMDRLIVMDQGKIVEQGTHADLLKLDGHYARLWVRQSGGFIDAEAAQEA